MLINSKIKYSNIIHKIIFTLVLQITFFSGTSLALAEKIHQLTILHTNDVHGKLLPFDYSKNDISVGGIARRAALIEAIKSQKQNVLLLDAGDAVQGSIFFQLFGGMPDVQFMSKMNYDAAVLGNHEFDKGINALEQLVTTASFPYLSANVNFTGNQDLDLKVKDYIIKKYKGFKVGIIGITARDLKALTTNIDSIEVLDYVEIVRKLVRKLDRKVDLIIVLSHIGLQEDIQLAKAVPGIDIIIGGHTHNFVNIPFAVLNNDDVTLIVQAGELGVSLGQLNLDIKDKKVYRYTYNLLPVNNKISEDPEIAKEVSLLSKKAKETTSKVIGTLKTPLDAKRDSTRASLTTAGCLITESIKYKYPDADIIMLNSGGIRANRYIKPGPITLGDILELYPFDNTVVIAELSGRDIKSILETSSRSLPNTSGAFLQTKSLEYNVDIYQTAQELTQDNSQILKEGDRVRKIMINRVPIDENKYYKVATNDFIFGGGDGFTQFKNARNIIRTDTLLQTLIVDYIKNNSPVTLTIKDKINLLECTTK